MHGRCPHCGRCSCCGKPTPPPYTQPNALPQTFPWSPNVAPRWPNQGGSTGTPPQRQYINYC